MDLWNDELIAHSLSSKRGDHMTYLNGLQDVIEFKKQYPKRSLFFIVTETLYMLPRATTNSCPCITSLDPCPEPARQRTMPSWKPSTDGYRSSCLRICTSHLQTMSLGRSPNIFDSSTKSVPHTPLDTLLQISIGNASRPSAEELTLDKRSL